VVSVLATQTVSGPPLPPGTSEEAVAEGSGLVLDRQGHILTAQHVIASASRIHVSFADGTKVHPSVLGSDPFYDLAVLEVDVPASTLHPLTLGSSAGLRLETP
jgi:putative serine protease PepD